MNGRIRTRRLMEQLRARGHLMFVGWRQVVCSALIRRDFERPNAGSRRRRAKLGIQIGELHRHGARRFNCAPIAMRAVNHCTGKYLDLAVHSVVVLLYLLDQLTKSRPKYSAGWRILA
jgi:hypothetical protein